MTESLTERALQIIEEEEAVLARVLGALRRSTVAGPATRDNSQIVAQLRALRDEAATASARDLPSLFQQMDALRAVANRAEAKPGPDPQTPYFAHLRLRGAGGARDYVLGRATFADTAAGVRVVDWRYAPVARVFYGYQEEDEYEEVFPGGLSEGVVEARRVVVIERGVLTRIMAGTLVLERTSDGVWAEPARSAGAALGGGAGSAARPGYLGVGVGGQRRAGRADITALLDVEQFEALSASGDEALLVLGSAGSGKTTVALHRLAKLGFDDPERYRPQQMRVIVPEEGLARLSRRLLEPLGFGRVRVETVAAWLYQSACAAFQTSHIKLSTETPALVARLKQHAALHDLLIARIGEQVTARTTFAGLRRRLSELFSDRTFLQSVVDASGGDLPSTAIGDTARHTMQQLVSPLSRQVEGFDPERLKTIDGRTIEEGTPDDLADSFDLEDLALLLFLKARAGGLQAEGLAHVVVDEAEDISLFEIGVLGHQLGEAKCCTLAGDEMQQTHSSFAGWPRMLAAMGAPGAATCRLQVSYRCPRPVVELAQLVLGTQAPASAARAGREGAPVGMHHFPDEAQAHLFLASALRELVDREANASVGVVASSAASARRVYQALQGMSEVRLVERGEFSFEPGVDVCDVDSVKGLEFDYVIIPDASAAAYPESDESRRRLHVAITRTSHQLWVMSAGRRTPVLAGAV